MRILMLTRVTLCEFLRQLYVVLDFFFLSMFLFRFKETNRGYLEEMQAQRAKAQSDREARFGSGSSSVSPQS